MGFKITKRFEFDAAHRLMGHEGACRFLHGHHYVVEVTVSSEELNSLGMVMDFGDLKKIVEGWLELWDHNVALRDDDPLVEAIQNNVSGEKDLNLFCDNPTVEWMGKVLFDLIESDLPSGVELERVRMYETPDAWCDYEG